MLLCNEERLGVRVYRLGGLNRHGAHLTSVLFVFVFFKHNLSLTPTKCGHFGHLGKSFFSFQEPNPKVSVKEN